MKITFSFEKINSFGGISFADHIMRNTLFFKTIDEI